MPPPALSAETVRAIVRRALAEDIGTGDVTTSAVVDAHGSVQARMVFREPGVVAGMDVAREVFFQLDAAAEVEAAAADGAQVGAGETAAVVCARTPAMLTGERVALNFLQRLSGIATLTRAFVECRAGDRGAHPRYAKDHPDAPRVGEVRRADGRRRQSSRRALRRDLDQGQPHRGRGEGGQGRSARTEWSAGRYGDPS